ncbi:DUF1145 domain-containing protein [Thalassolituus sp. LLYu03]|uniref:DUF1145 domain-containing protein n=1 Tax=Thalassolituus sp. LLYu03 TaxID=3421656 RepID=UPI003D285DE4
MLAFNKFATLMFWLAVALAYVFNWQQEAGWFREAGLVIGAIHLLEVLYFFIAFRDKSQDVMKDAGLILVFGIFHLRRFVSEKTA